MGIRISELITGTAQRESFIPVSDSAGTDTYKVSVGDIADLTKDKQYGIGNSGPTQMLALSNGNIQTVTLSENCIFAMPFPVQAGNLSLIITQLGSFSASFVGVRWQSGLAPQITPDAGSMDIITFVSDGLNWYGSAVQDLS